MYDSKEFREELLKGIVEVAMNTGLSLNECIYTAKEMLKKQKKRAVYKTIGKSNV